MNKTNRTPRLNYSLITIIVFGFLLNGCFSTTEPNGNGTDTLAYNQTAMLLDLYLSDTVKPSMLYYERIARDFQSLKERHWDEYADFFRLSIYFLYTHDNLSVAFDDTTTQQVRDGEYHHWDDLNEEYGLIEMVERRAYWRLTFECCSNMYWLGQIYADLPGVVSVRRNLRSLPESNIYPKVRGDTLTYYFVLCHGWDPAGGCQNYEYLYVRSARYNPRIIGYWNSEYFPNYPDWWAEAQENVDDWYDLMWRRY